MIDPPGNSKADAEPTSPARRKRMQHIVGLIVGGLLVIGALVAVIANRETMTGALDALASPSPLLLLLLVGSVLANIIITATLFHLLLSRFGRVGFMEMQALIAGTTLLNYLPLRPGLLGRVAYHKRVNDIAVRDSIRALIETLLLGLFVSLWCFIAIVIAQLAAADLLWIVCAPLPLLALACLHRAWRFWSLAVLLRTLDIAAWTCRYWLAFRLLGQEITWDTAVLLAIVSMFATMIPFISNGLGVREWAVGLITPLLDSTQVLEVALTADLVNRGMEMLIVVITGLIGLAWLARHVQHGSHVDHAERSNGSAR